MERGGISSKVNSFRFAKAFLTKRCKFQDYDYRAAESGVFPLKTDPLAAR
jgi:hypothetical protein